MVRLTPSLAAALALGALAASAAARAQPPVTQPPATQPPRPRPVLIRSDPVVLIDTAVLRRIREEGLTRSRVMETATVLSDVFGPRLAGSPQYRAAAEWARRELASYGLANAALEPWGVRS